MSHEREIRTYPTSLRAVTRNGKRTLSGRAAGFGTLSHDLGGFREVIAPGCFSNAMLRGDETIFCFNHDPSTIMARTRNKSLRLHQTWYVNSTSGGLDFEADLPDTTGADDLYKLISADLVSECSFAFKVDQDSWLKQSEAKAMFSQPDFAGVPAGVPIRVLEDLTLYDVSAVCNPAYPQGTGVSANSAPMDPAATRPHMEGASIPESVLVEARARGGQSHLLSEDESRLVRARARVIKYRLDDEEATSGGK